MNRLITPTTTRRFTNNSSTTTSSIRSALASPLSNRHICAGDSCPLHGREFATRSKTTITTKNPLNGFSSFGGDLLAHECGVDCQIHNNARSVHTISSSTIPPDGISKVKIRSRAKSTLSKDPQVTLPDLEGMRSGVYDVLLRNRQWAELQKKENPEFFRPLSEGQKPKYFVVCCSDSRCPSEKLMGFNPGECFTVRNIANCVMNADIGINAATQYAVDVLGVENILVVGHRDCGGIKAAMTRQSFGTTIDMYVRHIRDVYRQHIHEIDKITDPQARLNCLIEKHVIEQCINIFKMGFVQRARRKTAIDNKSSKSLPQIHGMVYDPSSGFLQELDIGLRNKARDFGKVYDVLLQ